MNQEPQTPQVFDPFSQDYVPRISNGTLEEIQAQVEQLVKQVEGISSAFTAETKKQETASKNLLESVSLTVKNFNSHAAAVLEGLRPQIKEMAVQAVSQALEDVGEADAVSTD